MCENQYKQWRSIKCHEQSLGIDDNQSKPIKQWRNQVNIWNMLSKQRWQITNNSKSMESIKTLWTSMEINEQQWTSIKLIKHNRTWWKSTNIDETPWKSMSIHRNQLKFMKINNK